MSKINLYLMFGGESPEHEISIITAKQILKKINETKYTVFPIYLDKNNKFKYISNFERFNTFKDFKKLDIQDLTIIIQNKKVIFKLGKLKTIPSPDICLLAFHGGYGENGTIQGFLDMIDIPYTGSWLKGSVYGMDKVVMKYILESNNIPILPWTYINIDQWNSDKKECMKKIKNISDFPYIVKPSSLGSSIGVKKVENEEELEDALSEDFLYDNNVIIEKFGKDMQEINYSIMQNIKEYELSESEEINKDDIKLFSYDEKYLKGNKKNHNQEGMMDSKKIIPANVEHNLDNKIKESTIKAYKILHARGIARLDFLIDKKNNNFYLIEINTIPGSLSFYLWEAKGTPFSNVIDNLINDTFYAFNQKKKLIKTFDSPLWKI